MSTTLPAPAARQAAVVAAIAALHIGAFLAVTLSKGIPISLPNLSPGPIFMPPPRPVTRVLIRPKPVQPGDYQPERVKAPELDIAVFDDRANENADSQATGPAEGGVYPTPPVEDFRGPALRTGEGRLQALIDSCYPPAARRRGQEGRGVARVVVDAAGRASAWTVEQTTGFAELDPGMGCVSRRVQFERGRRDGRAIEATVLMPIFFRLR